MMSAKGRVTDGSKCVTEELQSRTHRQPWLGAGNRSKGKHEVGLLGILNKIYIKRQAGKRNSMKKHWKVERGNGINYMPRAASSPVMEFLWMSLT